MELIAVDACQTGRWFCHCPRCSGLSHGTSVPTNALSALLVIGIACLCLCHVSDHLGDQNHIQPLECDWRMQ